MKTKVFEESFKGFPMFSIWEVDDKDEKVGKYPLISMGSKKAVVLFGHLNNFVKFAEHYAHNFDNEKRNEK